VIGLAFGGVRSARRGIGYDVASSREYRPGDDLAWMDWAASARLSAARGTDEFIVRERFADEAPRVVVLCDRRPSMSIPASDLRPLDKPRALLTALELIGASARAAGRNDCARFVATPSFARRSRRGTRSIGRGVRSRTASTGSWRREAMGRSTRS